MTGRPAARVTDMVVHPLPGVLTPGPGAPTVWIGFLPAWRGIGAGGAAAIQAAKQISDTAIQVAEAATLAAAGTPGLPAVKAAEETVKTGAAAAMGSMITAAASIPTPSGGTPDIHICAVPLPLPPHGPGVVIDGSPTVLINGLPACRMGDTIIEALGPPDKVAKGEFTVLIGNSMNDVAAPEIEVEYEPGIVIKGKPEFVAKTVAAMHELDATPTGAKLIDSLSKSGKTTTIVESTGGNSVGGFTNQGSIQPDGSKGAGSNSTVSFNPDRTTIGTEPWETRPPAIGLGHELIHANDMAHGTDSEKVVENDSKPDPADPTKNATEIEAEVRTVGVPPYENEEFTENKIRDEWPTPQPERKWY